MQRQGFSAVLMENRDFEIETIYVPAKRRRTLEPARVEELAAGILEDGQKTPIRVRADGERFVLVEGLHRLEACKALGETTIVGVVVQTPGR